MSPALRPMTPEDLDFAESLCAQAGWNQTREDWKNLLGFESAECFLAEQSGETAGTVSVIHHQGSLSWIGMLLVEERFRGQGIGKALLEQAITAARARGTLGCGLDATPAGFPLYKKRGFTVIAQLQRWEGTVPPINGLPLPPITEADWPDIDHLDRLAFGADRSAWLRRLSPRGKTRILRAAGGMMAFGMLRAGRRAWYLGPVVASNNEPALQIIESLLSGIDGRLLYWDAPVCSADGPVSLPSRWGFTVQRHYFRMILGNPPQQDWRRLIAIADPATG